MNRVYPHKQQGSSLLEVLIAILVISIGLLGLAGLQTQSIKSNHSSYLRSQATLLAYDLSDRMRMARTAALSGEYDTGSTFADKVNWNQNLLSTLGADASATVVRSANEITISITWNDDRGRIRDPGDASVISETFTYRTEL